jgi:acyl carrier protein
MSASVEDQSLLRMIRQVLARMGCVDLPADDEALRASTMDRLGLDSMLAIEVVCELEERLGVRLLQDEIAQVNLIDDLVALLRAYRSAA